MTNDNQKKSEAMTQFELGSILSKLDSNVTNLTSQVSEMISDFKEVHKDHEDRMRKLETGSASKEEIKRVHVRIDKLNTTIWKIVVYLASGGTLTGGGIMAYNAIIGG